MKIDLKITTGVAAALLAGGCGPKDDGQSDKSWTAAQDTAVCTDRQGQRVADTNCRQQPVHHAGGGGVGTAFLWYYLARNAAIPYYGERVGGGSFARAAGTTYARAPSGSAMTRSAAVSRGGFGASARGFGGVGE